MPSGRYGATDACVLRLQNADEVATAVTHCTNAAWMDVDWAFSLSLAKVQSLNGARRG